MTTFVRASGDLSIQMGTGMAAAIKQFIEPTNFSNGFINE